MNTPSSIQDWEKHLRECLQCFQASDNPLYDLDWDEKACPKGIELRKQLP